MPEARSTPARPHASSVRFSEEDRALLLELARRMGLSRTDILHLALNAYARSMPREQQ